MYDIDFQEKGQLKIHIRKFLLYPKYWTNPEHLITMTLNWNCVEFDAENKAQIPDKKGVYCFIVEPFVPNFLETKYLFYLGRTNRTLKIRFKEYLDEQAGKNKPRPKVFEMLNLYRECLFFYFAEINDEKQVDLCEEKLLNTFVPHINTLIPKAKIKNELKNIYE